MKTYMMKLDEGQGIHSKYFKIYVIIVRHVRHNKISIQAQQFVPGNAFGRLRTLDQVSCLAADASGCAVDAAEKYMMTEHKKRWETTTCRARK